MISDVLCDALEEIERYEKQFPDVYGDKREELARVKAAMDNLRKELDSL
jgi:molecular chaperone GrpE (heat shock protein)